MSAYDFIAADKKLEPLEIGVEDKGYAIIIEDEGHTLRIFEDEPSSYCLIVNNVDTRMNELGNHLERL